MTADRVKDTALVRDPGLDLFYKYRPWNQHTKRIITHQELWFANPASFNDPFDCQGRFVFAGTAVDKRRQFVSMFLRAARERGEGYTRRQAEKLFDKQLGRRVHDEAWWHDFEERSHDLILSGLAICSLTEIPDDIVMWAHYAQQHTGVCLSFAARNKYFGKALRVHYEQEYPLVAMGSRNFDEIARKLIQTKSQHWAYEKEWRIVRHDTSEGLQQYPKQFLHSVIVGCRASSETVADVRAAVAESGVDSVHVYLARRKEREYGLTVTPPISAGLNSLSSRNGM
jgi:hypothetical protein